MSQENVELAREVLATLGTRDAARQGSGFESASPAGWLLKFRGGKLLRFRAFREPAQALEAVGLAG